MTITRRRLIGAAALAAVPTLARAEAAWPAARPLRVVVPFPPGGTTDYVTRLVMIEVGKTIGQTVVIENGPGAGTVIGVEKVARSAPDGSSFVTVANSFAANRTLMRSLPYDTVKDLRPVALMGMSEHVLAAWPGSGIRSLADLRVQAKAKPGTLSFASFGNGTSSHLAGEMLRQRMEVDLVHVPYKGQSPAMADLLGGHVTMMFGNWPEFRSQIEAGRLVAVGMATRERSQYAPDIPTLAEQGVAIESNSWNGLLAPAATPDAIVSRMNAEINRALAGPIVKKAFHDGGIASLSGTPEGFAQFIQSEIGRYAAVIQAAHIPQEG